VSIGDVDADITGVKVMVVDDSKTIRKTAETLLKKAGCDVTTAIDGFEALCQIKAYDDKANVIIVSADIQDKAVSRVMRDGAIMHVQKPINAETIISTKVKTRLTNCTCLRNSATKNSCGLHVQLLAGKFRLNLILQTTKPKNSVMLPFGFN